MRIDENTTGAHLEEMFSSGMVQAAAKVDSLYDDGAQSNLAEVLKAAQSKLEQLGDGALALNIESEAAGRAVLTTFGKYLMLGMAAARARRPEIRQHAVCRDRTGY